MAHNTLINPFTDLERPRPIFNRAWNPLHSLDACLKIGTPGEAIEAAVCSSLSFTPAMAAFRKC
jgi:hypothetical protein